MPDSVYVAMRSSRVWYYQAKKNLAEEQIHSQGTHWPHCITNSHTAGWHMACDTLRQKDLQTISLYKISDKWECVRNFMSLTMV